MTTGPIDELHLLDQLLRPWHAMVIPLFGCDKAGSRADGVGSAFFLIHGGRRLLLTADHVIESLAQYKLVVATIHGKSVVFEKQPFARNRKADIACTELSNEWLASQGVADLLTAVNIPAKEDSLESLGVFAVIGYPASKNKLDSRWGRFDRYSHAITVGQSSKAVECTVPCFLTFDYDHEHVMNGAGQRLGPQISLHGMSGGPCLELVRNSAGVTMFRPIGVVVEHHRKDRVLIASPLDEVLL